MDSERLSIVINFFFHLFVSVSVWVFQKVTIFNTVSSLKEFSFKKKKLNEQSNYR